MLILSKGASQAVRQWCQDVVHGRALGRLFNASHLSLRNDFEVSSPELDQMVSCAQQESACYGARITGAGFDGCAIAIVEPNAVQDF